MNKRNKLVPAWVGYFGTCNFCGHCWELAEEDLSRVVDMECQSYAGRNVDVIYRVTVECKHCDHEFYAFKGATPDHVKLNLDS